MSEAKKRDRVFREMKWGPGQEESAKKRAARIAEKHAHASRDEMVASGELSAAVPWGELINFMVVMQEMRTAREQIGLSLGDVEARTGMARAQLSKLESGQINPTLQTLVRYAAGIGKSVRLVFEDLAPRGSDANGPHSLVH